MTNLDNPKLPDFSAKSFEPIFKMWQELHHRQKGHGMTTKDLAMMIYSFKTSLVSYLKERYKDNEFTYNQELNKLSAVLDFLGLVTFEFYSAENDQLITRQKEQIHFLQDKRSEERFGQFIGGSSAMSHVFQAIGLVVENDVTVLLQGESGTGKDLVANIIHAHSKRKNGPFVTLNCGAIPKELIESELFGHEKGAFTGADTRRLGKFELADGGTLFLDEIGELPLEMQVKLLRVLQNKEIERVGGSGKVSVNVRIISATNLELMDAVKEKKFRLDLYYRLNVFPISIPPLRKRKADIGPLCEHFIHKYANEYGLEQPHLTKDALSYLESLPWEGNIRELENVMQRAVIIAPGSAITRDVLMYKPGEAETLLLPKPEPETVQTPRTSAVIPLETLEETAMRDALAIKNGNVLQSAQALGISRTTFYNKAKKYGIELE